MAHSWPTNFPKVSSTRTVGELMKHPDFDRAKHCGDRAAADRLVADLIDPEAISRFAQSHRNARLVVVGGAPTDSNQIPAAFAEAFEKASGLPLDRGLLRTNSPKHTGKNALGRFRARAMFAGGLRPGANYVGLDDVMTQGGTISELRQFINRSGSRMVAVATLAHTRSSVMSDGLQIAPTLEVRQKLKESFDLKQLGGLLKKFDIYGGDVFSLTESECRLLCRFKSLVEIEAALLDEAERASPAEPLPTERVKTGTQRHVA
jgi:hypothetical protein